MCFEIYGINSVSIKAFGIKFRSKMPRKVLLRRGRWCGSEAEVSSNTIIGAQHGTVLPSTLGPVRNCLYKLPVGSVARCFAKLARIGTQKVLSRLYKFLGDNGVFALPDTERPRQTQRLINSQGIRWESVLVSISVQYEHLHTIESNPFLSLSVSGSVNTP